jgi:hypothetical protein
MATTPTKPLPVLSLESHDRLARRRFAALDQVRNALDARYSELPLAKRDSAAHDPRVQAILIAYGQELFDLEAAEFQALNVAPDILLSCLQKLANRVYDEVLRPAITQCRVELGALPLNRGYAQRGSQGPRVVHRNSQGIQPFL